MTKSRVQKRRNEERRNKKKSVDVEIQQLQQEVRSKEISVIPRENSRNGERDESSMDMLYLRCLRSIISERKCPTCERALTTDRQGGLSCPAGHIVGWEIGNIHREVDTFSIKES